jgi:hypothetical protein
MPVEEAGDLAEGLLRLRHAGIEELAVAPAFEDLEHGLDARLPEPAMRAHCVAEQQVARAAGQDGRREAGKIA